MKRIKGLDGLRAIAVALVVLNHKFPIGWAAKPGGYGVHLFFVLSGFLIISILAGRRNAISEGVTTLKDELLHFYANRAYRIWPIYYISIMAVVVIGYFSISYKVGDDVIASTLTFTSNLMIAFRWHDYPEQLGAMWSVAVEEQFYLWAAPVFLLCRPERYGRVCAAVIGIALLYAALIVATGYDQRAIYVGSLSNFGLMALGGLAALRLDYREWMSRAAPWVMAIYLLCIVLGYFAHGNLLAEVLFWGSGLLVALLLVGVAGNESTWFVKFLEFPPIKYVGTISYGIYIYHGFVSLGRFFPSIEHHPNILGIVDTFASLLVAAWSWHFIERPLLRLRDRRRQRVKEQSAVRLELAAASVENT